MDRIRTLALGAALLAAVPLAAAPLADLSGARARFIRLVDGQDPGGTPLRTYRARRRLEARARRDSMQATLDAWTVLTPEGFSWAVVQEDGSGLIRRRVLRAALETEATILREGREHEGAISSANYEFPTSDPIDDETVRIALHPRRGHQMLVDGTVVVDADSGDILEIEGLLSRRPSFWTRRVHVTRRYARVGGVHVPVAMESVADVLVAGRSSFAMTWCYEAINDVPVGHCDH